jgi:hypothetical protein
MAKVEDGAVRGVAFNVVLGWHIPGMLYSLLLPPLLLLLLLVDSNVFHIYNTTLHWLCQWG